MQYCSTPAGGKFPPVADMRLLPIVDMNPNNLACIFSTLSFIEKQTQRLDIETPCVTFDQPLWLKAVGIVQSNQMNVVCRLGGFHVIMSFLGSIDHIMAGSGLVESLQCCYGPVSINHMMTGKAVARAIRAHFLAESSLFSLMMESLINLSSEETEESILLSHKDIEELKTVYNDFFTSSLTTNDLRFCHVIITNRVKMRRQCRTSRLWLQYMDYVSVLKDFNTAERTSDWNLHIVSLTAMLNLFAASGHTHYAKSARLYLQIMSDLPTIYR